MATQTRTPEPPAELDRMLSENQAGLPGRISSPINVVIIGAGSHFTPKLAADILAIPGSSGGQLRLCDIDEQRLDTMTAVVRTLVARTQNSERWSVAASTDRNQLLPGADWVVITIEVSGLETIGFDNSIPERFGVDQCIGDTIGPGGLFKCFRTLPAFMRILGDCERSCPDAIVLNYTNPMGMLCLAANIASSMRVVGLCHSVQGTSRLLAARAGIDYEELDWECAGINHLAWFTRLEHMGRDLYPQLKERARADLAAAEPGDDSQDLVRKDMMLHFGAFITESSGHLSEYLPWYRKRAETRARFMRPGYHGQSGFLLQMWPDRRRADEAERRAMARGEAELSTGRTFEYASWVIEAVGKDAPFVFHGNVPNDWRGAGPLITNLPGDGIVELACVADGRGVTPTAVGTLPPQMAAVCRSNMSVIELGALAGLRRDRQLARQALMLDPLTAAVCTLDEIESMTDELFSAEADYLPGW